MSSDRPGAPIAVSHAEIAEGAEKDNQRVRAAFRPLLSPFAPEKRNSPVSRPAPLVLTSEGAERLLTFFRAKYSRFLRACYKVELRAEQNNDSVRISGKTDLGPLAGGEYDYEGLIQVRLQLQVSV